jgi:S-adenosylmethionine synthetase
MQPVILLKTLLPLGFVKKPLCRFPMLLSGAANGLYVNTNGTAKIKLSDGEIAAKLSVIFDMRPYFIEQRLKLRNPIYSETAAYGHMGRKPEIVEKSFVSPEGKVVKKKVELFTWEKLDYVAKIKKAFGLK